MPTSNDKSERDNTAPDPIAASKSAMRIEIRRLRGQLDERVERSERIAQRLFRSDWYHTARSILFYIDMKGEVVTREMFRQMVDDGRRMAVPYCDGWILRTYWCADISELRPSSYGILEPTAEIRNRDDRRAGPTDFDLILAPGVAFDRSGGRLGQGGGYYDRFLAEVRQAGAKTSVVGLAFDCQLVDRVPIGPRDMRIDGLITETATYPFRSVSPSE